MKPERIEVVFYWVTDLNAVLPFYTDVLGLEAGPRYGDWQEFHLGGTARFALHGGAQPRTGPTAAVSFAVESLEEAMSDLAVAGHHPTDEVTDTGAARFVTYEDPEGNPVQLLERR